MAKKENAQPAQVQPEQSTKSVEFVTIPSNLLLNLSICLSDIPREKMRKGNNGKIYTTITVSARKEPDQWKRDLKVYMSQSQEERRGGVNKVYIGGGQTVKVAESVENPSSKEVDEMFSPVDDCPFA